MAISFSVHLLASRFDIPYKSPWVDVGGAIIAWPIEFSLGVRYEHRRRARRARALGAFPTSEFRGKLCGDINIIEGIQENEKNSFVGELLSFEYVSHRVHPTRLSSFDIGERFATRHERARSGAFGEVPSGEQFMSMSTLDPGDIKALLCAGFGDLENGKPNRVSMGRSLIAHFLFS